MEDVDVDRRINQIVSRFVEIELSGGSFDDLVTLVASAPDTGIVLGVADFLIDRGTRQALTVLAECYEIAVDNGDDNSMNWIQTAINDPVLQSKESAGIFLEKLTSIVNEEREGGSAAVLLRAIET